MTDDQKLDFARMLNGALAYWRQEVSAFTMEVWWDGCKDFELAQVSKALSAHARDPEQGRFPPMVADIVRQLQGTQSDRSLLAWGKVLGAMSSVGSYNSVCFDDPAIHAAILDLGGWPMVCQGTTDELPHLQRRFCASHKAHSTSVQYETVGYLVGTHEASNRGRGLPVRPPMLVGDPVKCRAVMAAGDASGPWLQVTQASAAVPLLT